MPDFEIVLHYPFSKAINARGAVIRVFKSEDLSYMYVFPPVTRIGEDMPGKPVISRFKLPIAQPGEEVRAVTPPVYSRVVAETPGVEVRVS